MRSFFLLFIALLLTACNTFRDSEEGDAALDTSTDTADVVENIQRCLLPNAEGILVEQKCELDFCYEGFADCDDNDNTGCEAPLLTSTAHCGACDRGCGQGEACEAGLCVCGGDSSGSSPACVAGQICCGDACVAPEDPACACGALPACEEGELCCDTTCINVGESLEHCGACGVTCVDQQSCKQGTCQCPSSTPELCDGICTSLDTESDCGACDNACEPGGLCKAGECAAADSCYVVIQCEAECRTGDPCLNACQALGGRTAQELRTALQNCVDATCPDGNSSCAFAAYFDTCFEDYTACLDHIGP